MNRESHQNNKSKHGRAKVTDIDLLETYLDIINYLVDMYM